MLFYLFRYGLQIRAIRINKTTKTFSGLKYDTLIYIDHLKWNVYDDKFIWENTARLWGGELVFDYNTFDVKKLAQQWTNETFEIFKGRIKTIKAEWTTNPFYPNGESLGYKQFWLAYAETGDEFLALEKTTFYQTMKDRGYGTIHKVYVDNNSITVILKE